MGIIRGKPTFAIFRDKMVQSPLHHVNRQQCRRGRVWDLPTFAADRRTAPGGTQPREIRIRLRKNILRSVSSRRSRAAGAFTGRFTASCRSSHETVRSCMLPSRETERRLQTRVETPDRTADEVPANGAAQAAGKSCLVGTSGSTRYPIARPMMIERRSPAETISLSTARLGEFAWSCACLSGRQVPCRQFCPASLPKIKEKVHRAGTRKIPNFRERAIGRQVGLDDPCHREFGRVHDRTG